MAEPTTKRQRLAPEVRRRQIVAAALEVFAEQGYGPTDMVAVGDAVGVGRPLIYHYFPGGKEDLYVAVLEHAWAELFTRFVVEPGTPGVLPKNLATYLDLVEEGHSAAVVVRQSRLLEGDRIREATRKAGSAFARAMAVNQVGTDDPPKPTISALLALMAFYETLLEEWTSGRITRDQVESLMIETLPAVVQAARGAAHGPAG